MSEIDPKKSSGLEDVVLLKGERLALVEKVAKIYVRFPRLIGGVFFFAMVLMSLAVVRLGLFEIGEITQKDWFVASAGETEFYDALEDARNSVDGDGSSSVGVTATRSELAQFTAFQIIFEWEDESRKDDIFTRENLQLMCKFQKLMTGAPSFPKFCLTENANGTETVCKNQGFDLVAKFYQSFQDQFDCPLLDAVQFDAIKTGIVNATFFFQKTVVEESGVTPTKTRSQITLAGPLGVDTTGTKSYSQTLKDDSNDQYPFYESFMMDEVEPELFKFLDMGEYNFRSPYLKGPQPLGQDGLQVRYHSIVIRRNEFQRQVLSDQMMAVLSIIIVGTAMYLHLRSLFLTVTSMLTIVLSFPVTVFLYSAFLNVDYFTNIHIVAIFLILGVGADNVFVFVDVFKQSEFAWTRLRGMKNTQDAESSNLYGTGLAHKEVLIARLAYAMQRASSAVFNTSFTTFSAFMATYLTSAIAPISSFGLFSSVLILVNYLNCLLLYPALVTIYEQHFARRPFCCACVRQETATVDIESTKSSAVVVRQDSTSSYADDPLNLTDDQLTWEQKIFSNGYVPLMTKKAVAMFFVVALLVLMLVMGSFAAKLETPKTADEPFKDSHMFTGFMDDFARKFYGGNDFMEVDLVWGIETVDRDAKDPGFSKFDPAGYRGTAVFFKDFDLSTTAAQQFVLDVCDTLRDFSCVGEGETEPYIGCIDVQGRLVRAEDVTCTLELFHDWHNNTFPTETDALLLGEVNKTLWTDRLRQFAQVARMDQNIGFIEGELKFFALQYTTTLKSFQPLQVKEPILDLIEDFTNSINTNAPEELFDCSQTAFDIVWEVSEKSIVQGMWSGLAVSLAVAFIVLLASSGNTYLSVFAITTIIGILSCVLGMIQLIGWSLGVGEAIAVVMCVGLSVDYVLHLSHAYQVGGHEGHFFRADRFKASAIAMGATVVAGSLTTGGSSLILFTTQMAFFTRMATLISCTIAFSLFYSLFWFMPILVLLGPQGNAGDFKHYFKNKFCSS